MMNVKVLGIVVIVVIGIGIIYAIFGTSENLTKPTISDDSSLDINSNSLSSPVISDNAVVYTENQNYYVDEDGKRHYSLVAKTEPVISTP